MFLVYRVECPKCTLGPHTCNCDPEFQRWLSGYSCTDEYLKYHPGMLADVDFDRINDLSWTDWVCCFTSQEKLQWWFADLLEKLSTQEFQMAVYTVHDRKFFLEGLRRQQSFFRRHKWHIPVYKALPGAFQCAM